MRRALVLGALVVLAAVLVVVVEAPPPRTGEASVTGPRLFKMAAPAVERIVVTIGERRVQVERFAGRWTIDGTPVGQPTADVVTDLVHTLVTLRAVDRFRPADEATFGLDPPRATVELAGPERRVRMAIGELNAAHSAVYARHEGAPQVMLVGLYVISALERVVYFASIDGEPAVPYPPGR